MIKTTATDFKANLGKYLVLALQQDIHVTKNGSEIAVLTAPNARHSWVDDLTGVVPNSGVEEKQIKAERLWQKYESLD